MRTLKFNAFLIAMHFLLFHSAFAQSVSVNQTLVENIDVTGDNVKEVVSIHLKAESWNHPIFWTLKIVSNGSTIYSHESDDAWLDQFFNDQGFVNDTCSNYLECKKQYYLHDLPENTIVATKVAPTIYEKDINNPGGTWVVAKEELIKKFKLTEQEANETVELIVSRLKSGAVPTLELKISPVQSSFSRMYVEKVNDFVVIYEW